MKLSPAMIFILLLIFLVLSVLFCRWAMRDVDGFIGYNFETLPLETVTLPMYSDKNKLHKMYDSLYFDNKNGNVVEIDATAYGGVSGNVSGNIYSNGSTITALHVLPRIGNRVKSYKIEQITDVIPAPATTTDNSYQSKVYETKSKATDTYTVFMMPWRDNTYVHIMNNSTTNPENIGTYAFTNSSSAVHFKYQAFASADNDRFSKTRSDTNSNNNALVLDPVYNTKRKVYQISEFVKYDISNSNILVSVGDKEMQVHTRIGSTFQVLSKTNTTQDTTNGDVQPMVTNSPFAPRVIYDLCGQNMIVYVPNGKQTLVALVCYNNEMKLDLRNVCRFNEDGLDMGQPSSPNSSNSDKKDEPKMTTTADLDMDNYMLKTQIIPPVCPACPSCNYNNGGACNQCGGTGGCGTRTINGDSLVTGSNPIRGAIDTSGNVVPGAVDTSGNVVPGAVGRPVNEIGSVINNTVDTAGNVVNKTIGTASNVATGALGAASNVATGALGAASNVATGAIGAVGNVASSALGAVGNVLGGAGNMIQPGTGSQVGPAGDMQSQPNQRGSAPISQYPVSGSTSTTDPYSYQGALPAKKPTEFMPITADFSSFGR